MPAKMNELVAMVELVEKGEVSNQWQVSWSLGGRMIGTRQEDAADAALSLGWIERHGEQDSDAKRGERPVRVTALGRREVKAYRRLERAR